MGGFLIKEIVALCLLVHFSQPPSEAGTIIPTVQRLLATQERSNDILSTSMAGVMGEGKVQL